MAASKLNTFHWHLSDSQSFPYDSAQFPEMAKWGAYSRDEVYTPEDVKDLSTYARIRGVRVLVEIDSPAHAGAGWQWGQYMHAYTCAHFFELIFRSVTFFSFLNVWLEFVISTIFYTTSKTQTRFARTILFFKL